MARHLNGAQTLVRLLQAEHVAAAFGIVGGKLAPLLHAISRSNIRFHGVRHEAAAPMMAAAVFASTGRVAVALGEMGPGGLNLASGAGVAFNNHLATLLSPSWCARPSREALSGRPGPVHLDIPQDVLNMPVAWAEDEFELPPARYRVLGEPRPAADAVAAAVALLRVARRPLIVAGGGVVHAGADALVRALAARLRAPVIPTQMALGVVATDHPAFIGHGGWMTCWRPYPPPNLPPTPTGCPTCAVCAPPMSNASP